jgi:hypothetical protein
MSGIEVAGILLGAFPLIISAMEHYRDVKKPTAIWWKIRKAHNRDYNRLKECELQYQLQLELLLYPLLDDWVVDSPQYEQLLANPGGAGWKEPRVEDSLRERLQQRYHPYVRVMDELSEAMEKLCKATKVDDPQFQELLDHTCSTSNPADARGALMTRANLIFQGKRLKYSLTSPRRTDTLEEVESCIRRLSDLLKASKELSELTHNYKTAPRKPINRKLLGFWKHADAMFKLVQGSWSCICCGTAQLWLQNHRAAVDSMRIQLDLCHGRREVNIKVETPPLQLKTKLLDASRGVSLSHGITSTQLRLNSSQG